MAVPTITEIDPAGGLTIGRSAVKITGTGFRPAPSPPPAGYTSTAAQRTVSVTVDGLEAETVMVADDTIIWIVTPEYLGDAGDLPKAADVVVTNLDDSEVAIQDETVTEVEGYSYQRQTFDSASEGALAWVNENLILALQRHVIDHVYITTSPDYSDDPTSGLVAAAELPALILVGPKVLDDPVNRDNQARETAISGEAITVRMERPRTAKIIEYDIHALTRYKQQAMGLNEHLDDIFTALPRLRMPSKRGGSDMIDLSLLLMDTWEPTDDMVSEIHTVRNRLSIRGVKLRGTYGVQTEPLVDKTEPVAFAAASTMSDAFTLDMENEV